MPIADYRHINQWVINKTHTSWQQVTLCHRELRPSLHRHASDITSTAKWSLNDRQMACDWNRNSNQAFKLSTNEDGTVIHKLKRNNCSVHTVSDCSLRPIRMELVQTLLLTCWSLCQLVELLYGNFSNLSEKTLTRLPRACWNKSGHLFRWWC